MKTLRSRLTTTFIASIIVCSAASAQTTYYLHGDQPTGWNWNTVGASTGWHTAATGGTQLTVMDPGGIYDTNGAAFRTTAGSNTGETDLFLGQTLRFNGGVLQIKGYRLHRIEHLQAVGTTGVSVSDTGTVSLSVGHFEQLGTSQLGTSSGSLRHLNLAIDTLTGNAATVMGFTAGFSTASSFNLNIADASAFTGTFAMNYGTFNFQDNLELGGALTIGTDSRVNLTHSITAASLTIAGDTLDADTYSFSELQALYGDIFVGADLTGSITVGSIPEPSTYAALLGAVVLGLASMRRSRR